MLDTSSFLSFLSALVIFQKLVSYIFWDLPLCLCSSILVYFNDICCFFPNTHCNHVCTILKHIQENHLYAKLEKCLFEKTCLTFQGYVITNQDFLHHNDYHPPVDKEKLYPPAAPISPLCVPTMEPS